MHVPHWLAIVPALLVGASSAEGGPDRRPPIDAARLPPRCQQFLEVPSDAKTDWLMWEQRLSIAACLSDAIAVEVVTDPANERDVVAMLDHRIDPSVAIYQDAIANAPLQLRVVAAYGLGMTYTNVLVRARIAIPKRTLEPLLVTDQEHALAAFREAVKLADSDPKSTAGSPVIVKLVAASREKATQLSVHP